MFYADAVNFERDARQILEVGQYHLLHSAAAVLLLPWLVK